MHIAIDARIINSSTGRYVERLLHYLQKIDATNRYTVLVRKKDEHYWQPSGANFSVKVADFADYSFAEQLDFKKLLDELRPDLVHFCMPQQPVLYTGKTVTTIHDLTLLTTYMSDKNWFIYHAKQLVGKFVFKRVAKKSQIVITPTEYVKNSLVRFAGINPKKVTVTLEAAEKVSSGPSEAYLPMQGKDYIMYVGSQSDYKNIRRLIESHQQLLANHPHLELVLVGKTTGKAGAPAGRNKAWSESKGYTNITFTGFVPDEQLAWLYEHTRAYVFPSLTEGFGLPGLEAMVYGALVVSSNATCLPEVYGDAAEYFNPTSTEDMTNAINRILTNETRRDELIQKGNEQLKLYSWQRMAEQTHSVYVRVLSKTD